MVVYRRQDESDSDEESVYKSAIKEIPELEEVSDDRMKTNSNRVKLGRGKQSVTFEFADELGNVFETTINISDIFIKCKEVIKQKLEANADEKLPEENSSERLKEILVSSFMSSEKNTPDASKLKKEELTTSESTADGNINETLMKKLTDNDELTKDFFTTEKECKNPFEAFDSHRKPQVMNFTKINNSINVPTWEKSLKKLSTDAKLTTKLMEEKNEKMTYRTAAKNWQEDFDSIEKILQKYDEALEEISRGLQEESDSNLNSVRKSDEDSLSQSSLNDPFYFTAQSAVEKPIMQLHKNFKQEEKKISDSTKKSEEESVPEDKKFDSDNQKKSLNVEQESITNFKQEENIFSVFSKKSEEKSVPQDKKLSPDNQKKSVVDQNSFPNFEQKENIFSGFFKKSEDKSVPQEKKVASDNQKIPLAVEQESIKNFKQEENILDGAKKSEEQLIPQDKKLDQDNQKKSLVVDHNSVPNFKKEENIFSGFFKKSEEKSVPQEKKIDSDNQKKPLTVEQVSTTNFKQEEKISHGAKKSEEQLIPQEKKLNQDNQKKSLVVDQNSFPNFQQEEKFSSFSKKSEEKTVSQDIKSDHKSSDKNATTESDKQTIKISHQENSNVVTKPTKQIPTASVIGCQRENYIRSERPVEISEPLLTTQVNYESTPNSISTTIRSNQASNSSIYTSSPINLNQFESRNEPSFFDFHPPVFSSPFHTYDYQSFNNISPICNQQTFRSSTSSSSKINDSYSYEDDRNTYSYGSSSGSLNRSKKFNEFISDPRSNQSVTSLPGVGRVGGQHLKDIGIDTVGKMHKQLAKFGGDERKFKNWMKNTTGLNSRYVSDCFDAMQYM